MTREPPFPQYMSLSDVICHTGAAGKVVAGVRSWPDSESQTSRGSLDKTRQTRVKHGALADFLP